MENSRKNFIESIKQGNSYKEAYNFILDSFAEGEIIDSLTLIRRFQNKYPNKKMNDILVYQYDILTQSLINDGKIERYIASSKFIVKSKHKENDSTQENVK